MLPILPSLLSLLLSLSLIPIDSYYQKFLSKNESSGQIRKILSNYKVYKLVLFMFPKLKTLAYFSITSLFPSACKEVTKSHWIYHQMTLESCHIFSSPLWISHDEHSQSLKKQQINDQKKERKMKKRTKKHKTSSLNF